MRPYLNQLAAAAHRDDMLRRAARHRLKVGQRPVLGELPSKMQGQRVMVVVRDSAGKPIGNARVKLSAGNGAPIEVVTRSDGRAIFLSRDHREPRELPDHEFPFVLTTGRLYAHWHTLTRTAKAAKLMKREPEPFVEINPRDAARLDVVEGDLRRTMRLGAGGDEDDFGF